jgi:hypothetical protein
MQDRSSMFKFASIGELAETTTQLFALNLQYKTSLGGRRNPQPATGLDKVEQMILNQVRDYLSDVREGFVLSVRTTQVTKRSEIKFLLDRVLMDWSQLSRELGLGEEDENPSGTKPDQRAEPPALERVRQQLLAFGMAAVAFGQLPHLPAEQITFPYSYGEPPSYADIPAPDTPGETLVRIEELEQMVWQIMASHPQELLTRRYGALRRTYGFFETSACIAREDMQRFGIKKPKTNVSPF